MSINDIEKHVMHYSMLIQGSPGNGSFIWTHPFIYRNSYITSMSVLFRPNPLMFNNVDTTSVVTNTNGEELTIPPRYYTIGEIIAMLNIMTDTTFLISTMATSYGCISIQSPYSIDFTNVPNVREILGLEGHTVILPASFYGSNVIDIT